MNNRYVVFGKSKSHLFIVDTKYHSVVASHLNHSEAQIANDYAGVSYYENKYQAQSAYDRIMELEQVMSGLTN